MQFRRRFPTSNGLRKEWTEFRRSILAYFELYLARTFQAKLCSKIRICSRLLRNAGWPLDIRSVLRVPEGEKIQKHIQKSLGTNLGCCQSLHFWVRSQYSVFQLLELRNIKRSKFREKNKLWIEAKLKRERLTCSDYDAQLWSARFLTLKVGMCLLWVLPNFPATDCQDVGVKCVFVCPHHPATRIAAWFPSHNQRLFYGASCCQKEAGKPFI